MLFVVACVAAYRLTWGRMAIAEYLSSTRVVSLTLESGTLRVGTVGEKWVTGDRAIEGGWRSSSIELPTRREALYRFRYQFDPRGSYSVFVPLWMPALAVTMFMAWQWRRRRRRQAKGFQVLTTLDTGENDGRA
jgi:hypothetical protein